MKRLTILIGRLRKSVAQTKYFFKVPLVGRFMPLVGGIGRLVESPLHSLSQSSLCEPALKGRFHGTTNMNEINHRCIKISLQVLQTSRHQRMDIGAVQADD